MKKTAIILLAFGIMAIVVLAGCTQQQGGQQLVQYVCSNGTVVVDKNSCPVVPAGASQPIRELTVDEELSVCAGMPELQGTSFENTCITGLAAKLNDAELCKEVSSDQRTFCYSAVAEVAENPEVCLEAGTQKDQCYSAYAMNKDDALICDKITEVSLKDSCYSNFATKLGDTTLCDKIKTADQKNNCYYQIAQRLGDSSLCQKITNASMKDNCLQQTSRTQVGTPENK